MEFLVSKIYEFFKQNEKSLDDFLKTLPNYINQTDNVNISKFDYSLALHISKLCKFLLNEGLLLQTNTNPLMCICDKYISVNEINSTNPQELLSDIQYGTFDFKYNGFISVFEAFKESVVPIECIKSNGDYDLGTAFYIGNNMFVTAAHCVTKLEKFRLLIGNNPIKLKEVWLSTKDNPDIYDLAIIIAEAPEIRPFQLDKPNVLDNVLLMGYPPIPGMNPVLISEKASIGTDLQRLIEKTAIGQIAAEPASSYFSPMDYFIINARVKGGNSGSPVINEYGKVVGMVFEIPFDSKGGSDSGRYDIMGFGICFPSKYIQELQEEHSVQLLKECQGYFAFND